MRHTAHRWIAISLSCLALWSGERATAQSNDETARERRQIILREGAFLSGMRGQLRETALGWVIDFAPDLTTGDRLPSMVLQPGLTRTAMAQIAAAHTSEVTFQVDGQVFVYRGKNHLLVTGFEIVTGPARDATDANAEESPGAESSEQQEPEVPSLPGEEGSDEPDVEDLFENVKEGDRLAEQVSPTSMVEGELIASIRGRVEPWSEGGMIFLSDVDADGDVAGIPPLRCMPCLNLERLEALRAEWGESLIVTMSGRIYVEGGRAYLLPTMYVMELDRGGNLTLGQ